MSSRTSDLSAGHLLERLAESAEPVVDRVTPVVAPVVGRVNEALGRSPRRPTRWPWIVLGVVGLVAVAALLSRRTSHHDDELAEPERERLAS
jgi:hypothetical protein